MSFTCKDIESLGTELSDIELKELLTCRENGKIAFQLIDIREMFEYSDLSIKGTDILFPTSTMHMHMDVLEKIKESFIILYCRTGSRTGQMLNILKRMGFKKIAHLSDGIVQFSGEKLKNAPLPNQQR
jgi:rhodanese-related sulfurtransferase